LRRGLELLRRPPTDRKTVAEILTLAATHPNDVDTPLALTSVRADGWPGDLLPAVRRRRPAGSARCRGPMVRR
jgi:hypothetical protein